jgi:CRP-like cAMP-binding protein
MHADIPLDEVIQFLLDTPMFEHLNEEELSTVVHILELQRVQAGEVVFSAGDAGDAWFVIFQGTVEISHFGIEGMRVLTRLGSRGWRFLMATPGQRRPRRLSGACCFAFRDRASTACSAKAIWPRINWCTAWLCCWQPGFGR